VEAPAFSDSRRLLGPSRWLDAPGAVLEGHVAAEHAAAMAAAWRVIVTRLVAALGWPAPVLAVQQHAGHLVLAFTAPGDRLLTATEVNEWAWEAAGRELGLGNAPPRLSPGDLPRNEAEAVAQLAALTEIERRSPSSELAVHAGAAQHVALVTGSNGKTTTTRLIAAMTTANGWRSGWNCTDGVFIEGAAVEQGDWSGPAGAQRVVGDPAVEAAVLETARGGMLRRGLGVLGADVAVVTNVEADHFGEYGVHSLADLALVKLVVAKGLRPHGVLVLNADDDTLRAAPLPDGVRVRWFSATGAARGVTVSAWREGEQLWLDDETGRHDLGPLVTMPLTADGSATYNIANILAAAMAASVLGVPAETIAEVVAQFGSRPEDNAGRLSRFRLDGFEILLDYAHNPTGLTGLLAVARSLHPKRLLLLLGQAGNREDDALAALATAAWSGRPDRIVLKELEGYRRGRERGEVPALLGEELRRLGAAPEQLVTVLDEVEAVEAALAWARPGDLLVLPVHGLEARGEVLARLAARGAASVG
jgi:UDP-N-acetylmuramyl tripeptide synthase